MDEHAKVWPETEKAARWLLNDAGKQYDEPMKLKTPESVAKGWHRIVELMTSNEFIKEHGIRK